jgi:cyclopropane fatty-acyl-phospholipid synthase-like methyltransferase
MNNLTSPSVERNKQPILEVLSLYIGEHARLLEIGSGTGEHAIYFSTHFKEMIWVTSDKKEQHPVITQNLRNAKLKNVGGPAQLDVGSDDFPDRPFNYVFTANTLHIMSWKENKSLFKLLGKRLREGAVVFIYGPFNYGGKFTSSSNEEFDKWLKENNPASGVRHFEDVLGLMQKKGFKLLKDHEMPANNRLLVFERLKHQL